MNDDALVGFLRRALPRLHLRWTGFRKVRGQVRKRLARRMHELGLHGLDDYERFLESHPREWDRLDRICRITISRFYRDRGVWGCLRRSILPEMAERPAVRAWSVGCASGEEPYTLALAWWHDLRKHRPRPDLAVLATETDETLLTRARRAIYPASSLRELPPAWVRESFERVDDRFRLLPAPREPVALLRQDVRKAAPDGTFGLILCRNLAFTYFDESLQAEVLDRLLARLERGGALVIGAHESLPHADDRVEQVRPGLPVYRTAGADAGA